MEMSAVNKFAIFWAVIAAICVVTLLYCPVMAVAIPSFVLLCLIVGCMIAANV